MTIVTKKYKINGPNNIVRLTNGEKIIYLLGDYHFLVGNEYECEFDSKHESLDIDKFLIKFFNQQNKEKNKNFDFFAEMENKAINWYANIKKQKLMYLGQIRKIVGRETKIDDDTKTDNNKIIISKNYPNIRFHTFDFRTELLELCENYFYNLVRSGELNFLFPYNKRGLDKIYNTLIEIINNYNKSLEFLKFGESDYINKIKNKYDNEDIKKKINNIYQKSVIGFINYNIKLANKILDYMDNNKLISKYMNIKEEIEIQKFILINLSDLMNKLETPYIILVDLYLMRRVLDKKYTNNNIIYTGQFHLVDISVLLVKHFNYKITNIFYLDENIKDINKFIEKVDTDDYSYIKNTCTYLTNSTEQYGIDQCTDLFNFPDNFS
jgi:hypothetical protein